MITLPAEPSTGWISPASSKPSGGDLRRERWLIGTTRVQPFSIVKSVSIPVGGRHCEASHEPEERSPKDVPDEGV